MKRIILTAAVIIFALSAVVVAQVASSGGDLTLAQMLETAKAFLGEDRVLTPQQAYEMIQSNPDLMIIDVNTKFEFDRGHIKGALIIPRGLIEFKITKNDIFQDINKGVIPQKNTTMLLYCKVGGRCLLVAETLKKMGYTDMYTIKGGLEAWKTARLPLEIGTVN